MKGKPCLWCGVDLDTAPLDPLDDYNVPTSQLTVTCRCGLSYSLELIESTPWDRWLNIFREKGYRLERDGEDLVIHETGSCPC